MTMPDDALSPIPRAQWALFVRGADGEPIWKLIQDLEDQQGALVGLPAAIAAAQATADAAIALLVPFVAVNHGGTGLVAGTSGGILGFTGVATLASSALLAQHGIVLGGGAGATPSTPVALGTAGDVLTSQGAGVDPVFSAIPAVSSAALSRVNDTNVTVTLGGTPASALLQAVSLTLGWTGQLSVARGGTGLATLTAHALYVGNAAAAPTALAVGANNTVLHGNTGADPSFSAVVEADITLANNTTNDVTIARHGFAPIAPNDATKFLNGLGAWAVPSASPGNLTGPITSVGLATSIASQTGTGTKFVVDTSPTLVTPILGVAAATSINFGVTALNYYGEGTWTPTDNSGAGLAFGSVTADYTRIGRMFNAAFNVSYPATADGSQANIAGFPFTFANTTCANQGTMNAAGGVGGSEATINLAVGSTTAKFLSGGGAAFITNVQLSGQTLRGMATSHV